MITLTGQELIDLFEAGRTQGSDEATALDWGERPNCSAKTAFIEALQQIIYDRRVVEHKEAGTEVWPTGAQWPDEDEVRDAFGLKHT